MSNKLKSFDLEDNNTPKDQQIVKQMPTIFDPTVLSKINLSDNNLEKINPNLFDLPNLIYLNVEKNRLKKLPRIISLSKLLFLNISENPFEKLKFDLPVSIMTFYCSSCNLKEIPDTISDCISLSIFFCMDNEIETLPELPSIGMLNASNNKIKKFPSLPKSIKQVDLSLNKIESLPDDIDDYTSLFELDLSYNNLKNIPNLQNLTNLVFLKLSHNQDLEGKIDLSSFHMLETFDVSFTHIKINEMPAENIRELIVSVPSEAAQNLEKIITESSGIESSSKNAIFTSPQVKVMTESDFAAYSEMRGSRETMEDALIARPFMVFLKSRNFL